MRWSDLDVQGHVNNALYVDYLQEARVEYLSSGPNAELLGKGIIVTRNQVEFRRPLLYSLDAAVEVRLWLSEVGGSRFVVRYEIIDDGELTARAATTCALFDIQTQRLRRFTPEQRAALLADVRDSEPMAVLPRPTGVNPAHLTDIRVRWSDLDSYGHVNNYRFYDYAQEARSKMILGSGLEWAEPAPLWLAVRQDCDYLRPVLFRRQSYQIATSVSQIGTSSMHLVHELRDDSGVEYASARAVLVHADGTTGKPAPLPTQLLAHLEKYAISPS